MGNDGDCVFGRKLYSPNPNRQSGSIVTTTMVCGKAIAQPKVTVWVGELSCLKVDL